MRSNRSSRSGQTLPMFAIALVAVLGFAGLALDGSRLYAEHERVQRAADAAAIAAAHELRHASQFAASRWREGGWVELDAVWAEEEVFGRL